MTKLNKFISDSGCCSRRKAADLIKDGQVTVNGTITLEPYYEVQEKDAIKVNNKLIQHDTHKLYFLFNKPQDVITTASDPQGRRTVMDFFKRIKSRVFPVGRLDRNTTGVMLVTNDGDLTQKLSHPKFGVSKTYHVTTHKPVTKEHMELLLKGVKLEDGFMKVDKVRRLTQRKNSISVTIHSGKKHVVKRLFKQLRYFVERLDRTRFAGLTKQGLPLGTYRPLLKEEIQKLKDL
ncbi:MAG: pseudouridine synthase [Epsilonproteobacteria bacterium]|nr:pseudouridine synthase [Campylobacterota bacterium]|tara:strand:+ start:1589 stop:2290 length:702 start_codon:yes stop_codon:yes gene_type:complete